MAASDRQQGSPRGSKDSGVSPVRSADGGQQNEQSDLNVELLQVPYCGPKRPSFYYCNNFFCC